MLSAIGLASPTLKVLPSLPFSRIPKPDLNDASRCSSSLPDLPRGRDVVPPSHTIRHAIDGSSSARNRHPQSTKITHCQISHRQARREARYWLAWLETL